MSIPNKAVKAVILKNNKILLLQSNKKNRNSDVWDLPGGLIDDGENEEEALLREIKEELGVNAKIKKKIGKWQFFRSLDKKTVFVQNYLCDIMDDNIVLSNEHQDYRWLTLDEIKNYKVKDNSFFNALN